jgi:hypothetical protein
MTKDSRKSRHGDSPAENGGKTVDAQVAACRAACDQDGDDPEAWGEYADAFYQDLTDIANHFRDSLPLVRDFGWSRREETELRAKVRHLAALMPDIEAALAPDAQSVMSAMDARNTLAKALAAARTKLKWAEIRELVFAAELKTKGAKVEEI